MLDLREVLESVMHGRPLVGLKFSMRSIALNSMLVTRGALLPSPIFKILVILSIQHVSLAPSHYSLDLVRLCST